MISHKSNALTAEDRIRLLQEWVVDGLQQRAEEIKEGEPSVSVEKLRGTRRIAKRGRTKNRPPKDPTSKNHNRKRREREQEMKPAKDIVLVGMSNIGKSWWSQLLSQLYGYRIIDIDTLIMKRLEKIRVNPKDPRITAKKPFDSAERVAKWLGLPHQKIYIERSFMYLTIEQEVMRDVIAKDLLNPKRKEHLVIDVPGSIAHHGEEIIDVLRRSTQIYCLDTTPRHNQLLFQEYCDTPKPVYWPERIYQEIAPATSESKEETAERHAKEREECYPKLLEYRTKRYRDIAHEVIPFGMHFRKRDVLPHDLFPGVGLEELPLIQAHISQIAKSLGIKSKDIRAVSSSEERLPTVPDLGTWFPAGLIIEPTKDTMLKIKIPQEARSVAPGNPR